MIRRFKKPTLLLTRAFVSNTSQQFHSTQHTDMQRKRVKFILVHKHLNPPKAEPKEEEAKVESPKVETKEVEAKVESSDKKDQPVDLGLFFLDCCVILGVIGYGLYWFFKRGDFSSTVSIDDPEIKNCRTKFDDVKGIDECKSELEEIVFFLKNPELFQEMGGKLPKGVLLYGSPGVGKTLLARAIAGEAGVPFFSCSAAEFDDIYVGSGPRKIRKLFSKAKRNTPCILFIDEIDAVGSDRAKLKFTDHVQTINQLLTEMDGFTSNNGLIVIAATNMKDNLDPALLRPGRLDRHIEVPLPDSKGRKEILELYLKKTRNSPHMDVTEIIKKTTGFSGADLSNLVNVAVLRACKLKKEFIENQELEYAFDRIVMGVQKQDATSMLDQREKEITAIHESGHALITLLNGDTVNKEESLNALHKVTIIPRGDSLGYTSYLPKKDYHHITKQQYYQMIEKCLGGVVAEEVIFGPENVTSGCTSDLNTATLIAFDMVKKFGMSELGLFDFTSVENSPETKRQIDLHAQKIVNQCYEKVKKKLKQNESNLKRVAKELLKYETLSGKEVSDILLGREINRQVSDFDFVTYKIDTKYFK